jgi:hypothetical protein
LRRGARNHWPEDAGKTARDHETGPGLPRLVGLQSTKLEVTHPSPD